MTDLVKLALIASIPTTITGLASFIVAIRNGFMSKKYDARSDVRAGELMQKTDEVHTLVDGNLSKVQLSLAQAMERIQHLEKIITELIAKK